MESAQVARDLHTKGQFVASAPLHPVATATSVHVREGKSPVTDGLAETHEQLGGFYLVNAQDLDEAIAIATHIPGARVDTVEICPVLEIAGLPAQS